MDCGKAPSSVRKPKKKQVKDEQDRIKQAEKKKRRLEKALATSAAIISELEKKKQREREEQQRLDAEGAAIAEAVALQVLTGEEDSGDPCGRVVNYGQRVYRHPSGEFGVITNAHGGSVCQWDGCDGYGWDDENRSVNVDEIMGAGMIAARAVSGLRIADDEDMHGFVFNRMVRG